MTGAEFSSWESPEFIDNPDHVSEYFMNVPFPSNDLTCGDSGMELGHESAGSAQDEARQSRSSTGENPTRKRQTRGSRGANKRRKRGRRPVSGNSREAKGIGILGESSSAFQLESADGKEGLKPKILIDRVDRQINKAKKILNETFLFVIRGLGAMEDMELLKSFVSKLRQIEEQWPLLTNLRLIREQINQVKQDSTSTAEADPGVMNARLLKIENQIVTTVELLQNFSDKTDSLQDKVESLQDTFLNQQNFSFETLKEELFSIFTEPIWEDIFTTTGQSQAIPQACEQLLVTDHVKDLEYLESEVLGKDNNTVDVTDFQGLEEAVKKNWPNIPEYLEPIARRVKEARGDEVIRFADKNIQILVCAAIYEMENMTVEELNRDGLKKWGATFNQAKEARFEVKFAEIQLKKNLYAYFVHSLL